MRDNWQTAHTPWRLIREVEDLLEGSSLDLGWDLSEVEIWTTKFANLMVGRTTLCQRLGTWGLIELASEEVIAMAQHFRLTKILIQACWEDAIVNEHWEWPTNWEHCKFSGARRISEKQLTFWVMRLLPGGLQGAWRKPEELGEALLGWRWLMLTYLSQHYTLAGKKIYGLTRWAAWLGRDFLHPTLGLNQA